jgi:uncharacterized protein
MANREESTAMNAAVHSEAVGDTTHEADPAMENLKATIEHAAHLLPAQGPITVFIHHNTLHAFEDLPFHDGIKKGARVFGCQAYLSEDRYRDEMERGRIRVNELQDVLRENLRDGAQAKIAALSTRFDLRLSMLQYPLRSGPTEELVWFVAERDALRRIRSEASSATRQRLIAETRHWVMRDLRNGKKITDAEAIFEARRSLVGVFARFQETAIESWSEETWEAFTLQALWRICCEGVAATPSFAPPVPLPLRHRDVLLEATGIDADALVHEVLIPFCAAFLDQGLAHWRLPRREEGFYRSFAALFQQGRRLQARWMHGLDAELARLESAGVTPLDSIRESLAVLGIAEDEWDDFIAASFLALRGWAGMVAQIEARADRVVRPVPAGSVLEFLAIRLLLDRWAVAYTAKNEFNYTGPLSNLRKEANRRIGKRNPPSVEQRAFLVFQLAQLLGWTPKDLHDRSKMEWAQLMREIETFTRLERCQIFHEAYERRFNTRTLDAIALHSHKPAPTPKKPRFQVTFCIDDREESIRRHLEELAPDVETFSLAGFYFIPMYFRGVEDAHFVPLCPVVIRPQHWVAENVVESCEKDHQRRVRARRALGLASHQFHIGTRSFALGALLSAAVGILASAPLVARTFFPRLTARLKAVFGSFVQAPPSTELHLERREPEPGPENGRLGFTLDELTNIAERALRDIGLTSNFSRLILTLGHGSSSVNNPHESAYHCGACGGARGGPNGRAIAKILNDPRIRERLFQLGIHIPDDTVFVGGLHNTSNDFVTLYDTDRLPDSHREEFAAIQEILQTACDRNAHERSRRFVSAPLTLTFESAHQHVEGRAEDLAQVRPELGHATNAISIVGKRDWTRGLFLDRRAFLTSYDPDQDDADHTILTRILLAIFPVCAGISLEYYFSQVDNVVLGCGTKLPHNVTALLGVMDGAASDLRTGLPLQMIEIHEPVRLLNVIETTPEAMLQILAKNAGIARLCDNGWVHLTVLHPKTRQVSVYKDGKFVPYTPEATTLPRAASSVDWYRGWRDHLEFAAIGEY